MSGIVVIQHYLEKDLKHLLREKRKRKLMHPNGGTASYHKELPSFGPGALPFDYAFVLKGVHVFSA